MERQQSTQAVCAFAIHQPRDKKARNIVRPSSRGMCSKNGSRQKKQSARKPL